MQEMVVVNATVPQGFNICNQPNIALWSTILCLCTFAIAVILRKLRQSRFLGKEVCCCCYRVQYVLLYCHRLVDW